VIHYSLSEQDVGPLINLLFEMFCRPDAKQT